MTGDSWIFMGVLLVVLAVFLITVSELGIVLYRRRGQDEEPQEGGNGDEMSELSL